MTPRRSRVTLRVRYAETDNMGVAHHAGYFVWFEVGRTELIRELGYAYKQLEADGLCLPVIDAQCSFLRPAFYDDVLTLESFLIKRSGLRLKIGYELFRGETLIARGHTVHAFTDMNGKPTRPLLSFLEKIS
jgi:acyl-CoA thioester hydrolase